MRKAEILIQFMENLMERSGRRGNQPQPLKKMQVGCGGSEPVGTYVQKFTPERLKQILGDQIPYEVRCWRSVSVRFLRAVIHKKLAGKLLLRLLYQLEDRFANYFGKVGQYPLIILMKLE
jgi:hypothetical protein